MCVVFGANRRAHVAENSQVWNFHLNKHDLVALNGINNSVFATRDPRMIP
jgi:diketogulonate reductase-like aldo/keto reductase